MAKRKKQNERNAAIINLDGFFDLDEEAQTDMIVDMLEMMSPNPEVREAAIKRAEKR